MAKHVHHSHLMAIISIFILLAMIGSLSYLYFTIFQNAQSSPTVVLTGYVQTYGLTTYPTSINFVSPSSAYHSSISNGRYAISVPSGNLYSVIINYGSLAGLGSGSCNAGTVVLENSSVLVLQRNFKC